MRYYPEDDYDWKEVETLGLSKNDWRINALKMNPSYCNWGNSEAYMCSSNSTWNSPVELNSAEQLWKLDDLNELINFYFVVYRKKEECNECEGTGYNKETLQISKDWYDFDNKGTRWCDNITQDEVEALWNERRLSGFKQIPTAEEVNQKEKNGFIHDEINRLICVEQRAKRLNVYGLCSKCQGKGYNFIEDKVHLALQMWFIHPRRGASRGVYLKNIEKNELPKVIKYLQEANKRNNERFSKLKNKEEFYEKKNTN